MRRRALGASELDGLAALTALPEDQIDTRDIPEAPAENWRHARRGDLYRLRKQSVTESEKAELGAPRLLGKP